MKTLVIIPTFNEKENIKLLIKAIFKVNRGIEVLVVDDNSPDNTWKIIRRLEKKDRRVHLIKNPGKLGLGPAYIIGIKYAIDKDFDYIIQMDGDFSHDPQMIPILLESAKKHDFVIGSRYIKGGKITGWKKKRLLLSSLGNLYARFFLGSRIRDWTSGFICWRRGVLNSIELNAEDCPNGYAFLTSLKFKALTAGFKAKETPIIFKDRTRGMTKMHGGIVNEAVITIIKLRYSKDKKRSNTAISTYPKKRLKNVKVSIGIPAYNEEKDIIKVLNAITNQKLRNGLNISEIIVVNDDSSDKTEFLVREFIKKNNSVRIFSQAERKGKSAAINCILSKAKENLVVIANADNIPQRNCLQYLLDRVTNKKVALVGPRVVCINSSDSFVGYANNLIWRLHHKIALKNPKTGGFVLIKKEALSFIPDESPVDEPTLEAIVMENGYQVAYEPHAVLYLKGPKKFKDYFSQRRRIHAGYLWLGKKYVKYHPPTFNIFNLIAVLFHEASLDIVNNSYLIIAIIIEVVASIFARYDFRFRNKNLQVWQVAASSKNLKINEKS